MDREQLTARIEQLEKQRDQLVQQANLQIATLNGSIAECRWQLEQLDKAVETTKPEQQSQ